MHWFRLKLSKVAIVLLALVAVAAADVYGKGYAKQTVDYSHVPYYNVDWAVMDDYYNDYAQAETRSGDNTKTNWRVALPGKSWIKRDDVVNAEMRVSQHAAPSYSASAYGKAAY